MKPKIKSKTLWFNGLSGLTAVATIAATYIPSFGLEPELTAMIMMGLTLAVTAGNWALRLVTTEAVGG